MLALPPGHPYLRLPLQMVAGLDRKLRSFVDAADLERLEKAEAELEEPDRWGTAFTPHPVLGPAPDVMAPGGAVSRGGRGSRAAAAAPGTSEPQGQRARPRAGGEGVRSDVLMLCPASLIDVTRGGRADPMRLKNGHPLGIGEMRRVGR